MNKTTGALTRRIGGIDNLNAPQCHCINYSGYPWQVKFLQGTDGNVPWVWVMGEHKDDLSYEELVSYHNHLFTNLQ